MDFAELDNTAAALKAGVAIAEPKKNPHEDSAAYAVVPDGFSLHYIERVPAPFRRKGTVKLLDVESFIAYFKEAELQTPDGRNIYGTLDPAQFLAVLNDHKEGEAGWRDHRALFTLKASREWETWRSQNKHKFEGNVAFAEWIEDQAPDFLKPGGAEMLQIAINFRVGEKIAFANPIRLQNGQTEFSYTQLVEGSSEGPKGKIKIPEGFTISIPIFAGWDQPTYEMRARLRYRLKEAQLFIWYELERPHVVVEKAFKAIWDDIAKRTSITILHGTPE